MESCGDCGQSQEAVRVKEELEHPPSPVDCYLATPIKEETDNARPSDCLDETHYVKEEVLCVDSEEQEASCSETAGWGGASTAAMLASLYANHTIKDEVVLEPEVLHRPNEETDNARPADCLDETQYVKEEALCVDSEDQGDSEMAGCGGSSTAAMLAGLYADHTIKDELVLGPEVLHRPNVTPVFRGWGLAAACARPQEPRGGARLASDCSVRLERLPPRPAPPAPRATHEQDIHTHDDKEKELICDLCGEKFGLKCDLLRHAVVHIYTPTSAERGQAGRGADHSVDFYLATPIKEETDTARPADCLDETQYVKEEALCVDSEEQEASCSETAGWGGSSAAAMLAGLYADHTIKDELVLGPEVLHRPNVTPVFHDAVVVVAHQAVSARGLLGRRTYRLRTEPEPAPAHTARCDHCGEAFGNKSVLIKHLQTHLSSATGLARACNSTLDESNLNQKGALHTDLRIHKKIHKGEKLFHCNHCVYNCSKKSDLLRHQLTHTGVKPFQCNYCDYKSNQKSRLRRHEMTHTGVKPFSCDMCDYKCGQRVQLLRHQMTHTGVKPFQCNYCDYRSIKKSSLRCHEMTHTGVKPFSCDMCDYKCGQRVQLLRHQMTHTGVKPFQCNYCDYKSNRKSNLRCHEMTHTGVKFFRCDFCDYKCSRKVYLHKHEMRHTGIKPFNCNYCDYKCSRKAYLHKHEMIHTGIKPFNCDFCDYKCSQKDSLRSHEIKHTGIKPFNCDFCDYKCSRKGSLRRHEMKHTGTQPFSCKYCNYKCIWKRDLLRHEMKHTGTQPLKCSYCDYKCIWKRDLLRHEMKHTGTQPLKCSYCDYKCSRKEHLLRHEMIHTGIKPFNCNYCDFKCNRKENLRKHETKHTGMN